FQQGAHSTAGYSFRYAHISPIRCVESSGEACSLLTRTPASAAILPAGSPTRTCFLWHLISTTRSRFSALHRRTARTSFPWAQFWICLGASGWAWSHRWLRLCRRPSIFLPVAEFQERFSVAM